MSLTIHLISSGISIIVAVYCTALLLLLINEFLFYSILVAVV